MSIAARAIQLALVVVVAANCVGPLPSSSSSTAMASERPPDPTPIGETSPGAFYLVGDPEDAPFELSIRENDLGGPSGKSVEFATGDRVELVWTTLAIPAQKWIELNGRDCDGSFGVASRSETDLLLIVTTSGCRIEVLGTHPAGASHVVGTRPSN
jgi:hypothetical protein